jgi:ubiquitin carboxyl-terminal hydrolase 7
MKVIIVKLSLKWGFSNESYVLIFNFSHVLWQIFPLNEKIENINDQYWTLRAEEVDIKIQFSVDTSELSCVLHCQISVFAYPNGLSVCIVL